MCYRKSFVTMPTDQVQMGTCPSCGMPVAASVGITSGDCPHCGKPVTIETAKPFNGSLAGSGPQPIL